MQIYADHFSLKNNLNLGHFHLTLNILDVGYFCTEEKPDYLEHVQMVHKMAEVTNWRKWDQDAKYRTVEKVCLHKQKLT